MSTARSHFLKDYSEHLARLEAKLGSAAAVRAAVGGEFEAIGKLELALLRQYGLGTTPATVVDVGCGSGRLAVQLSRLPHVHYIGSEIMPGLLKAAEEFCARPDWQFVQTDGTSIPAPDSSADFICFFSVFTHLLHQETYRYLESAKRALKPGGTLLFTFLEFRIPCHWSIFESSLDALRRNAHLDQFLSRDAITAWAEHLQLEVVSIEDGDKPHIPLAEPIVYEADGRVMSGLGNFGQSVAVLRKPAG